MGELGEGLVMDAPTGGRHGPCAVVDSDSWLLGTGPLVILSTWRPDGSLLAVESKVSSAAQGEGSDGRVRTPSPSAADNAIVRSWTASPRTDRRVRPTGLDGPDDRPVHRCPPARMVGMAALRPFESESRTRHSSATCLAFCAFRSTPGVAKSAPGGSRRTTLASASTGRRS